MAGIAGVFSPSLDLTITGPLANEMVGALKARAGGRERIFAQRHILLLQGSVESSTGEACLSTSHDGVTVVFDGEIYNAPSLSAELERAGARTPAGDDAALLGHLYRTRGVDMVRELNGAFAFALWDEKNHRLVLGRDRLGEMPLFYARVGDTLVFASDLRCVLAHPAVRRDVDVTALDAYFTYQYVPPPMTIYRDIRALPPAHLLISEGSSSRLQRYWELHFSTKRSLTEEDYCEHILDRLEKATRLRASDGGRYGAYLSGGTDSSLVVAALERVRPGSVEAFTIGAQEETLSDIGYARAVANLWKVPHHPLEMTSRSIEVLPRLVWQFGEPYADSSLLPTYFTSLAIRQMARVAFCGDGADECFGGYLLYQIERTHRYRHFFIIPGMVRRAVAATLAVMPNGGDYGYYSFLRRAKRISKFIAMSPERRYVESLSNFTGWSKDLLYGDGLKAVPGTAASALYMERYAESDARDLVDRFLALDLLTYLPGDILPKFDIATAAAGLVVRSPFLDHELVELAATIPAALKIRGTMNKYILKEAATRWIPRELIYRPKKGFSIPVDVWLRGAWGNLARTLLAKPALERRGFLNPAYVQTLLDEHTTGAANHDMRIWVLMNFEIWCRTFLDSRGERPLTWEELLGRELTW
jgi:asparagine synthase (glutamine-hydrolysing)